MAKIIAVANQKGGVAKTTTTSSFAAALYNKKYKVLAVDIDPQGNLTDYFDLDPAYTAYEIMKDSKNIKKAINKTDNSYDIICSNLELASADMEFTKTGREYRLKKALQEISNQYDFILIDTPPALGILTVNAFIAANEVIIPASGTDGIKGIVNLTTTINTVKEFGNENLKIKGILLTMFNPRTIIDQNIKKLTQSLSLDLNIPLFKTCIRKSVAVDESKITRKNIFDYASDNNVAIDYKNFTDEYLSEGV